MNYKIIKATEFPADEFSPATLVVQIIIEGLPLSVGGISVNATKATINRHIEDNYQSLWDGAKRVNSPKSQERTDLSDIRTQWSAATTQAQKIEVLAKRLGLV